MKKLQRFQLFFSIVPYVSAMLCVFISYYYCFVKYKKNGFPYVATIFVAFFLIAFLSRYISLPWVKILVDTLIYAVHNFVQVLIQKKCIDDAQKQ